MNTIISCVPPHSGPVWQFLSLDTLHHCLRSNNSRENENQETFSAVAEVVKTLSPYLLRSVHSSQQVFLLHTSDSSET